MTVLNILFWLALALDAAAILLFFFLGLAAAGPSKTNPLSVVGLMLILPGLVLAALAFWFVAIKAPISRIAALAVAASPGLIVLGGQIMTWNEMRKHPEQARLPMAFKPVSLAPLENAVLDSDANAIAQAASEVQIRGKIEGGGVIILALHRLEKSPDQIAILKALLDAGADPNSGYGEKPLEVAIRVSRKTGNAPVELLLKAGANPNALNPLGEPVYFSALQSTVDLDTLQLLLDRGANPKLKSYSGESAQARALANKNPKAASLLGQL